MPKSAAAPRRAPKALIQPTKTAAAASAAVGAATQPAPVSAVTLDPLASGRARVKGKVAALAGPVPTQAKASAPVQPTAQKAAKVHKPKLVRDSFTIPKDEYEVLTALKRRALGLERHVRKSELLRAGIRLLHGLNDRALLKALESVPQLKTGRPKAV